MSTANRVINNTSFLNAAMASTQCFMFYSKEEKNKDIFNVSFILHLGISLMVGIILIIASYVFSNGILDIGADRIFADKVVYGSLIVSTIFAVIYYNIQSLYGRYGTK